MAEATNINILNALRNRMSLEYSNRIPEATRENIGSIYEELLNTVPIRNDFVNSLIGLVVSQRINSTMFENPLGVLKKEPMRYGAVEEEIYINMAKGYQFNQFASVNDLFAYYKSSVMSAYHKLTTPMQYAVTITFDNLRNAFLSEYGIRDLINAKVQSLFSAANYDEFLCMKSICTSAYDSNVIYPVHVDPITTKESAENFTQLMKEYIGNMRFPHPEYNIAGADSTSNDDSIFYLTTPKYDSMLDVKVLQTAFNLGKVDIRAKKILVDKFDNPNIVALLFDMRFFNVKENFRQLSDSRNGAALTWNYFYTVSEMFSYSPFFNIIAFTTEDISENMTLTVKENQEGKAGTDVEIIALVSGDGGKYTPQTLDYAVEGATSAYTAFIPGSNILHVANDEKAKTLTINVTSRYDTTKKGTGTFKVLT